MLYNQINMKIKINSIHVVDKSRYACHSRAFKYLFRQDFVFNFRLIFEPEHGKTNKMTREHNI